MRRPYGVWAPPEDPGTGGSGGAMFTQAELEAKVAEANKALEANRDAVLADLGKTKDRLRAFDGLDPEAVKADLEYARKARETKALESGDFESLKGQLLEQHGKEIAKRDQRERQLMTALERRLIDADATAAIASARGSVKVLLPHIRPHVRVAEVDGEFVAQVVDAKGAPRIADGKATPMSISDLVAEFRNDPELARAYDGTGSSGGGASRSAGGAGGPVRVIPAGDNKAFIGNLDDIASGKVVVADT